MARHDDEPITPPGRLDTLQELRLPLDTLRWAPAWLKSMRPRRAAHPRSVILLPGYGAGPRSMHVLSLFLRRRGHYVSDWGLGRNDGDASRLRAGLMPVVEAMRARHDGGSVTLVGWSLGGYIAREYAREHPADVRKVVTLGSPVIGGPRYTATARRYREQGYDLDRIEQAILARYAQPLQVPVAAIYSKRDGIVAWRACIDRMSPDVRHIEVSETHIGLVFSPKVLGIVAEEVERAQG
jgi:pimeloyl-ACP methyl ester carboxylesterase